MNLYPSDNMSDQNSSPPSTPTTPRSQNINDTGAINHPSSPSSPRVISSSPLSQHRENRLHSYNIPPQQQRNHSSSFSSLTTTSSTGSSRPPSVPVQPPYRTSSLPSTEDLPFHHLRPSHSPNFHVPYVQKPLIDTEHASPSDAKFHQFHEENPNLTPSRRVQQAGVGSMDKVLDFVPSQEASHNVYSEEMQRAKLDMRTHLNHNLTNRHDEQQEEEEIQRKRKENSEEYQKRRAKKMKELLPVQRVRQANSYAKPFKQKRELARLEREERERIARESNPVEYEWATVPPQEIHSMFETPSRETIQAVREKLQSPLSRMQISTSHSEFNDESLQFSPVKSETEGIASKSLSPVHKMLRDQAKRQFNRKQREKSISGKLDSSSTSNGDTESKGRPHWEYMRLFLRLHGRLQFFFERDITEADLKKIKKQVRELEETNRVPQENESTQTDDSLSETHASKAAKEEEEDESRVKDETADVSNHDDEPSQQRDDTENKTEA